MRSSLAGYSTAQNTPRPRAPSRRAERAPKLGRIEAPWNCLSDWPVFFPKSFLVPGKCADPIALAVPVGSSNNGGMEQVLEYVAFDLETTGLVADTERVVEIGAVRFDSSGAELGRFECLVNPLRSMPPGAQAIHGISDADLAGASTAETVLPGFLAFLGDPETTTLLAHNSSFD